MAGLLKSAMAESQERNKESVETERYETKLREQEASIKRRDVKVEQLWTQMRAEKAAHEKAQAATSALKHELEEVRRDQRRATEELREKLRASEAARLKAEGECRDLRERMQRPVAHDKSHSRPALHGNDRCRHDQASEIFKLVNRLVRDVSDQETVAEAMEEPAFARAESGHIMKYCKTEWSVKKAEAKIRMLTGKQVRSSGRQAED